MKKLLLVPLMALVASLCLAQNESLPQKLQHFFAPLDKSQVPSGYLYDQSWSFAAPSDFRGSLTDSNFVSTDVFGMLYGALRGSCVSNSPNLPAPSVYLSKIKQGAAGDTIQFAVMAQCFDRIRPDALSQNLVSISNGQMFDVPGRQASPYWQDTLFAASLLAAESASRTVVFTMPSDLWFSNLSGDMPSLSFDPGDGNGWLNIVPNQLISVEYPDTGEREIKFRLVYPAFTRYAHCRLTVKEDSNGAEDRSGGMKWPQDLYESMHVTASESYMGAAGSATMHIFYNTHDCNSVKRMLRPLIIVEGYEEIGVVQNTFQRMFALLDMKVLNGETENLSDYLYPYEYDLIYVDFDDGSDWIQRNAFVVKEVIKKVNEMKAAAGSTEENVIIGVSMGGIVSKYALLEMQANGPDHDTRLFFTYDSPLRGANIPIATQLLVRFMVDNLPSYAGDDISIPSIDLIWEGLQAPVPQQLLKYHVNSFTPFLDNPVHAAFIAEMDALGGLNMRHVALSNGAGTGTFVENNIVAGERFFELGGKKGKCEPVCGHVRFDIKLRATGGNGMNTLFYGYIERQLDIIPIDLIWTEWIVNSITKPYDTSPGGSTNLGVAPLGSGTGGLIALLSAAGVTHTGPGLTATHHCFIPTFSSVSATEPSNFGTPVTCGTAARCTTSETAETSPYSGLAEINQAHIFLDERIASVLIDELVTNSTPPVHPLSLSGNLNTYFNVGLPIYSPIPTITIHTSNGKLSINNTGKVAFATGNEPNSPYAFLFSETRCDAVITVENGAKLVVGADGAVKDGILKLNENSIVHIKPGGILQITGEHSSLIITHGTRLILDPGANVILESNGANIRIEGELVLNGNINFSGPGHFVFAEGNQLTFGPNYNTFFLDGMSINQRYVRLEAPVRINNGHRLLWTDGLVEITEGYLDFTTGAGANFERVTFAGGGEAIIAHQASAINLLSCVATGVTFPIQGVECFGLYVDQCQFDAYSTGIAWQNSAFFNVVRSTFTGQTAASAMNLENVGLAMIGADYIAGHTNGTPGITDDAYFSGSAAAAVELNNVDYCVVRNSQINTNDVGIRDMNPENPSNVFLIQGTTLFENVAGVYMIGNEAEGLVLADCATFARNKFGVRGRDITLMIDALNTSISPLDEDQPNAFLRDPFGLPQAGGAQKYIEICYELKAATGSALMRNNYWGSLTGAGQP